MNEFSRQLVSSQTNRRMVDAMSLRRWERQAPFIIERVGMVPVEQKKAEGGK